MIAISKTKVSVCIILIFYFIVSYFTNGWVFSVTGYEVGNRRRVIAVLKLELSMILFNMFIYNQLMQYFDDIDSYRKIERKVLQIRKHRFSCVLMTLFFFSQAIYFMYYVQPIYQTLFFDITTLCAGIWTNLLGFVSGCFLVNCTIYYLGNIQPFKRIFEYFSQFYYMKLLMYDRKFQIKTIIVCVLSMSLVMFSFCDQIVVKHKTIPIKNFSAQNKPFRVAVISDIHAGASVYREQVLKVVDHLLPLDVDAVFIVGDLVDGPVSDLENRISPLWIIAKKFPTYFVTGNHEYYYGDAMEWINLYKKHGIHVLQNENVMVNGICLAGVNDISSGKSGIKNHEMNATVALKSCPSDASRILLAHNPASVQKMQPSLLETVDLIISGHTHAGQFYVVVPVVYWMLPYYYGLYDLSAHGKLLVSAGTLYQGPNMKMIGMSEIWVLNLVNA